MIVAAPQIGVDAAVRLQNFYLNWTSDVHSDENEQKKNQVILFRPPKENLESLVQAKKVFGSRVTFSWMNFFFPNIFMGPLPDANIK